MNVTVINHPLIRHKPTLVCGVDCSTYKFRTLTTELTCLMVYGTSHSFEIEKYVIDGWYGSTGGDHIKSETLTTVPALRAGLGVLDGVLDLTPTAEISVVGLQCDEETLKPVSYLEKSVDNMDGRFALIIDPMLVTGGSMVATIDLLKAKNCRNTRTLVLAVAPKGVKTANKAHPDVTIYTAALDNHLNGHGYIVPGLGDTDDKIFDAR